MTKMRGLLLTFFLFNVLNSSAQNKQFTKQLKILAIEDNTYAYLLKGVDSIGIDTFYFISLKSQVETKSNHKKIAIGQEYKFILDDMDFSNGHYAPPSAFILGYTIRFPEADVKRQGRHGTTVTSTQFRSINTIGLWIKN